MPTERIHVENADELERKTAATRSVQLEKPLEQHDKLSSLDIQLVQSLVERCLQLYMNQREVVCILREQAKIDPGFTGLVWQKLEEQNPDFFRAYYSRLGLKEQIVVLNQLVAQHHCMPQRDAKVWKKEHERHRTHLNVS